MRRVRLRSVTVQVIFVEHRLEIYAGAPREGFMYSRRSFCFYLNGNSDVGSSESELFPSSFINGCFAVASGEERSDGCDGNSGGIWVMRGALFRVV